MGGRVTLLLRRRVNRRVQVQAHREKKRKKIRNQVQVRLEKRQRKKRKLKRLKRKLRRKQRNSSGTVPYPFRSRHSLFLSRLSGRKTRSECGYSLSDNTTFMYSVLVESGKLCA